MSVSLSFRTFQMLCRGMRFKSASCFRSDRSQSILASCEADRDAVGGYLLFESILSAVAQDGFALQYARSKLAGAHSVRIPPCCYLFPTRTSLVIYAILRLLE
jgi:hypothetical protein